MQPISHSYTDGEPDPRPVRVPEAEPRAAGGCGAVPADDSPPDPLSEFERRLHSFGLGAQQRTLLGPTVFADDLEPETR